MNSKTSNNSIEAVYERIRSDRVFADSFVHDPRKAIQRAGIELPAEQLKKIEDVDWAELRTKSASFTDDQVLRCSVGF